MNAWLDYVIKLLPTLISGISICLALIWRVHSLQLKQDLNDSVVKIKEDFNNKIENIKEKFHEVEIDLIDRINNKRS